MGWLLAPPSLLLPDAEGGLTWLDAQGATRGRLGPELAEACRAQLEDAPERPPSPLLSALRARGAWPELAGARPLEPLALLRRDGWGLLFLELTATCNERCAHCYAESSPQRREALDEPTARAVLRDAAALGFQTVQFTGGEALLCPFLSELCAYAFALGLDVEVYTNGTLLSAERYEGLRRAAFAFSLYARDPAVHDAITRLPGSHEKTLAAIRRALGGGSRVRVSVVLTRPGDLEEAQGAVALATSLGVEQVAADLSRAVGRGGTEAGAAVTPAAGELQAPAQSGGPHRGVGHEERGTAAVLPDGSVVPCILSRALRLGRVGPEGGLRAALERPQVALRAAPCAELSARVAGNLERMTCAPCRLADALLSASRAASPA